MFSILSEEGYEELGEIALVKVNGGTCTGFSAGACTSSPSGNPSGDGGDGGGDTPSNPGTCTSMAQTPANNSGGCTGSQEGGGNPVYFRQDVFYDVFGDAVDSACAATSLLNEISEQYTASTGEKITRDQASAALQAAVDAGKIQPGNARVNNWAGAANAMWSSLGQDGSFSNGGDNPSVVIYAVDSNNDGYADHFVNSNGNGTYYGVVSGGTYNVSNLTLATEGGGTRTLSFTE